MLSKIFNIFKNNIGKYIYIYIRFGTKIIDKEGLIDITNFE